MLQRGIVKELFRTSLFRDIGKYMKEHDAYRMIIEPDGDQYHGYVPALPGCHTHGSTIEETRANLRDAISLYLADSDFGHELTTYAKKRLRAISNTKTIRLAEVKERYG